METAMPLHVTSLRCEHLDAPLGLGELRPRLSWRIETDRRGARQSAFRLIAAASSAALDQNQLLWDTGRVEGDQSLDVVYEGAPLASAQRVFWRVEVWDDAGDSTSADSWWEMGLLRREDWAGAWVGAPFSGGPRTTSPAPFLRTTFAISRPVASARLYATALGLYECHINGARVGEDLLTPGWTDYAQRAQYQVYDVTALLHQGENALGAILGDGWYCGYVAWGGRQLYGDRPRLLAQLAIVYEDGSSETIASGPGWKVAAGPILESDMLMGESYDARRELPGWNAPGYDDASWAPAEIFADTGAALTAAVGPPVRRQEELRPVSVQKIFDWNNSRYAFDLGQNMVGWVRLRVRGEAGATVTLRYAEVLNPDGTLYTTNLRSARNTDHYTLRGGDEEVWEPHFLFHGFRYVELSGPKSGLPHELSEDAITGIVVHSDIAPTGQFECSNPLLNQLQRNIVWGQKGNFVDVPTDCPQRDERLGWTGDAQVFVRTAAFNRDVAAFFSRWTRDLEDSQSVEGAYPAVAPNPRVGPNAFVTPADGGPAWADAGTICPWTIYLCYGDRRILEARYESMQRYISYLDATSRDKIRCYAGYEGFPGFGDWLALDGSGKTDGGTPKELIGTAFFAHSARLLSRVAQALGKHEDAARYEALFEEVRRAFQARYVTPSGLVAAQTQTAYVLALHFDLLPAELRAVAASELVRDIERRGDHLSTGFVGTSYLPFVLSQAGRLDLAYRLLHQQGWPSWLYAVTQGATTIWERWDGWTHDKGFQDPGMNSFNHYAYGAIGEWLYSVVAGLDLDPEQPGYKHLVLRPHPGGGLEHARASLQTRYGLAESNWQLNGNALTWDVTVPPNTHATAYVPAADGVEVLEGSVPAADAVGVTLIGREGDAVVARLGAGRYSFRSRVGRGA
jgi:alpha-L-rhamnosidase